MTVTHLSRRQPACSLKRLKPADMSAQFTQIDEEKEKKGENRGKKRQRYKIAGRRAENVITRFATTRRERENAAFCTPNFITKQLPLPQRRINPFVPRVDARRKPYPTHVEKGEKFSNECTGCAALLVTSATIGPRVILLGRLSGLF